MAKSLAAGRGVFFAVAAFLLSLHAACAQWVEPPTVQILVLSLFHPKTLLLQTSAPATLDADDASLPISGAELWTLAGLGAQVVVTNSATTFEARAVRLATGTFTVSVPGKLTRTYTGALTVTASHGVLSAVLTLPTELAVASIVAAEASPGAAPEALKAQAVAARSYLLARLHAHAQADACDTTHCQYLRSPPPSGSPASQATLATRNQVLIWRATPESPLTVVAAMYSRSCGGHTQAHPTRAGTYPFFAVACGYCLRHPERWSRTSTAAAPKSEAERIAYNRVHGWSAIPSNTHEIAANGMLQGRGIGHGIGLCQLGAQDLATRGQGFPQILAHFFPDTSLFFLPQR